ncbi:MAG: hypothetical protein FWC43_13140 [Planctomycetaceae bacterium]|nr:hypothetical protein [Planctomycetaceae bacterium]
MKLIVTIVNRGYSDELMAAARLAGANGGTILNARGTGTAEDAIYWGINLTPEKEVLLIVANPEDAANITEAIRSQNAFNERGAGIVFTLNLAESFFPNNA